MKAPIRRITILNTGWNVLDLVPRNKCIPPALTILINPGAGFADNVKKPSPPELARQQRYVPVRIEKIKLPMSMLVFILVTLYYIRIRLGA